MATSPLLKTSIAGSVVKLFNLDQLRVGGGPPHLFTSQANKKVEGERQTIKQYCNIILYVIWQLVSSVAEPVSF